MILPLEKQVCNQILAKRLKELGVRQDSLFYWLLYQDGVYRVDVGNNVCGGMECGIPEEHHKKGYTYAAFTSAELDKLLPEKIYKKIYNSEYSLRFFKDCIEYYQYREGYDDDILISICVEKYKNINTLFDAKAKTLIYLIENNYIKVEDINKEE